MKKFLSLLMMSLLCVSAGAGVRTSSLIFEKECNGSGTADDGVKWNVKSDGTENTFDSKLGVRFGSNKETTQYVELSTSDVPGTITNVVVNTCDQVSAATVSVTVDGEAYECSGSTTATDESADYSFSGSGQGFILVRIDRGEPMSKAIYVKSVIVTYEVEEASVKEPVIVFDPAHAYEGDEVTCTITCETEDATIMYSLKGDDFQDYSKPFTLTETTTVRAKAVLKDGTASEIVENTITFDPKPVITLNPDFGEYEGTQTVFVTVDNMPKDAVIVYNFVAAPKADVEWLQYDETKGIEVDKSGMLTVAVNDAEGAQITSIEGDYTINTVVTGIDEFSSKAVASVRYINVAGMSSDKAFDGINIVVTTFTDGSKAITKAVK